MFEYHSAAIAEAWEAFHWYQIRSEQSADAFWKELRRARAAIERHPKSWSPYLHGTRCLKLERYPFALVYIDRGERIIGVAVAHLKRKPGYWKSRLGG